MVKILEFIRWKNLLIIALIVFSLKYLVFHTLIATGSLVAFVSSVSALETLLLIICIQLIAAGGNVINDILDVETDRINHPKKKLLLDFFSQKEAYVLYLALTLSGLGIAGYLAYVKGPSQLFTIVVVATMLLWLYSSFFKSSVLIGNLMVAFLSALVPLLYFFFEIYQYLKTYGAIFNQNYASTFDIQAIDQLWNYTLFLAVFAFIYSLIREIIKDLQDLDGDQYLSGKTLPLFLGETNTLWILRILLMLVTVLILFCNYKFLQTAPFGYFAFQCYVYLGLILPNLVLLKMCFNEKVNYHKASKMVKLTMVSGILSTLVFFILS